MKFEKIKIFVASAGGLGLIPLFSGSFGALLGLGWHYVALFCGWNNMSVRLWCFLGGLIFSCVHYALNGWAQEYWNDPDPKNFVMDEIVGYLCVPVFMLTTKTSMLYPCVAFCIFRIVDAIKLPGARYVDQHIHTANGVLFDDIISAAYTAIIMSLVVSFN